MSHLQPTKSNSYAGTGTSTLGLEGGMEDAAFWGDADVDDAGNGTAWERQLADREIERLKTEMVQVGAFRL